MKSINTLFSILKINSLKQNLTCYLPKNNKNTNILEIFYNEGLIKKYIYDKKKKKYLVFLKYKYNLAFINNIINISKPSNYIYFSYKKIIKLLKHKNYDYLLINTSENGYKLIENYNLNNFGGEVIAAIKLNSSIYKIKRKHVNVKPVLYKHLVVQSK
tara:strand:+ start:2047 stop:2520 length:474 start_codon:yes stop_codon:yes gene_type:complete